MRAVLASIKPFWAGKVYSGEKGVELRKTAPSPESGTWDRHLTVYLYESGTGLVTGEFEMCGVEWCGVPFFTWGNTCLTDAQAREYGPDKKGWYCGWHILRATKYDEPKRLCDFHKVGYSEAKSSVYGWTVQEEISWQIRRPPQSWCYVEEQP